jgi:hypothetical protein
VPFTFNSAHGDEVHLSQTIGTNLTGFRARAKFGAAANGVSFGRFVTSVREEFVAMSARSFGVTNPTTVAQFRTGTGAANPYPLVGPVVISEINYRPASSYNGDTNAAEFIELLNIASTNVPLYDPNATSNTWRLADGVDFVFPTNVSLPVGGSLLIVSFDPVADSVKSNWFRSTYAVPASVPMLGPYAGGLASEGEDLELLKPDPPQAPPSPDAGFVPYVLVEHVHYLATGPWPTNGIGSGASLQRSFARNFGNEPLNWFTGAPSPGRALNDSDGDGLPDYWELAYGLNPNDGSGNNGASGDFDGDRQSNGQEFLAGTSPTSSADNLRFRSVVRSGNTVRLQFNAGGGRTYSVLFSNNSPLGPWQKLADAPLSPSPTVIEIIDSNLNVGLRFYRLVAPQIP